MVDICISSNFHPIIFSAIQRIPFIAISYSTKIDDFICSLNLTEYLLRIDKVNEENLIEKIQHLIINKDAFLSKLDKYVHELKQRVENNFQNISNILKSKTIYKNGDLNVIS
jgi:polysaccharide pyruvyl transferase WcaK-like protein